jgi:PAS domain S-box-containing protein
MTYFLRPITSIYFIGVIISTILAMIIMKRRPAPGALAFAIFNLGATWWILTCILEYGSIDLAQKIFWSKLQSIGILSSGLLWLIFTLDYTRHSSWRSTRNIIILCLFPLITWGIVLTNEFHGLYWTRIYLTDTQFGKTALWDHGVWFWVSAFYQYLCVIIGIILLIRFKKDKSLYHARQLAILVLGATAPLAFNLIYLFHIKALDGLDFTPLSLSISGFLYSLLIFRFHFLDVNTLARNSLVEQIPEGILVLNTEGSISDINPIAERLLGNTKSRLINRTLSEVWPELHTMKPSFQTLERRTILCNFNNQDRYLDVSLTTMLDRRGSLAGELFIIRDVTAEKLFEANLRQSEEKFSRVFHSSPGVIIIATLDGNIIKVNQRLLDLSNYSEEEIVGKNFFENPNLETSEWLNKSGRKLDNQHTLSNIPGKVKNQVRSSPYVIVLG